MADRLGSQRELARLLDRPQRQVWGWITGEHELRRANREIVASVWAQLRAEDPHPTVGQEPRVAARVAGARRHLRVVEDVDRPDEVPDASAPGGGGYYLPLEDYGAVHTAGALARTRVDPAR